MIRLKGPSSSDHTIRLAERSDDIEVCGVSSWLDPTDRSAVAISSERTLAFIFGPMMLGVSQKKPGTEGGSAIDR
jgi:hypothetical protein